MITRIVLCLSLFLFCFTFTKGQKIDKRKIKIINNIYAMTHAKQVALQNMSRYRSEIEEKEEFDYLIQNIDSFFHLTTLIIHDTHTLRELKELYRYHKKGIPVPPNLFGKDRELKTIIAKEAQNWMYNTIQQYREANKSDAQIYFENDSLEIAIVKIDSLLALNANNDEAYFYKGRAYAALEQYNESLFFIDKAIEINPKNPEAYFIKAVLHIQLFETRQSLDPIKKAVQISPNNSEYLHYAANIYMKLNMHEEAIELYTKLIHKNEANDYKYYTNRATAHKYNREPISAKQDFQEAAWKVDVLLEDDSNNIDLQFEKAVILIEIEKYKQAIETLDFILSYDSTELYAYNLKCLIHLKERKYLEGLNLLEMLLKQNPDNGFYLNQKGYCLIKLERLPEALDALNLAIEKAPNSSFPYSNRGFIKYKQKDFEGAEKDILYSLELQPTNYYAFKNLGLLRLSQNKLEEACNHFHTCIENGFTELYGDEVLKLIDANCQPNNESSPSEH